MHYLSITAMFRQENRWLKEWIDYHIAQGVEHFYLYDNDEPPGQAVEILRPYLESKIVECRPIYGTGTQGTMLWDTLNQTAQKTEWLAIIDLDEFLLPRNGADLRGLLEEYQEFSGLVVNWNIFGTSGYIQSPPDQINHLLWRAEDSFSVNRHVKSIVKPHKVNSNMLVSPHIFNYHSGYAVNENMEPVHSPLTDYCGKRIRLNHYILRSVRDFWDTKVARGLATPSHARDQNFFDSHDRNEVFDDEISRLFGTILLTSIK